MITCDELLIAHSRASGCTVIEITLPDEYQDQQAARDIVERLMGRDPAKRFEFIQSRASAVEDDAIDA